MHYITNKKSCKHCLQWNMNSTNDVIKFDPPNNYHSEMLPLDRNLVPKKLSFHKLKAAVELAFKNYMNGKWSESCIQCYVQILPLKLIDVEYGSDQ